MKKKFVVKSSKDDNGKVIKAIFVDGEMLDYSIDEEALKKVSALGAEYKKMALLDIERHFIECLSEFVGRKLNKTDITNAFMTGWI